MESEKKIFWRITPPRRLLELRLKELWQYRDLLLTLSWRDIQVRYKQTVLGVAWAVIQPLAGMMIFTVIFAKMAKLPTDHTPAPIFYYTGLLAWTFFSQTVSGASQNLLEGSRLITKVYFPRIMIPASVAGYTLVNFLVSLVLLIALMAIYRVVPSLSLLALPLLLAQLTLTSLGIGFLLAALNVRYRDFRYVVPFLLQLWMFASPVVYPESMIPESWRAWASLNPMTGLVSAFRSSLLGLPWDGTVIAVSFTSGLLCFVVGVLYFQYVEDDIADIL